MQLFVNDLTVIDFSYLCPVRGMVGESWIVDVVLDGGLDEQNMVLDFAKVKRSIKQTIDNVCDHRLLVPVANDAVRWLQQGEQVMLDFASAMGPIHLACPEQAFARIETDIIDFESVNRFLIQALQHVLPQNVAHISLILRHQLLEGAYYHYSHGLKNMTVIVSALLTAIAALSVFSVMARQNQLWSSVGQSVGRIFT